MGWLYLRYLSRMTRPTHALSLDSITERLPTIPGWEFRDGQLMKLFTLKDFAEAIAFIVRVSFISEKLDHHAEITNLYNRVTLKINTHTVKGITKLDFDFAGGVEKLRG